MQSMPGRSPAASEQAQKPFERLSQGSRQHPRHRDGGHARRDAAPAGSQAGGHVLHDPGQAEEHGRQHFQRTLGQHGHRLPGDRRGPELGDSFERGEFGGNRIRLLTKPSGARDECHHADHSTEQRGQPEYPAIRTAQTAKPPQAEHGRAGDRSKPDRLPDRASEHAAERADRQPCQRPPRHDVSAPCW